MPRVKLSDTSNKLVFLGTAGARYVAFGGLRQAGGIFVNTSDTSIHIDPGPGAFVYGLKKGIKFSELDAIFVSHRHLDHCADVNHLIEAITLGGKRKKGILLCPEDVISEDPVVLKYTMNNLESVRVVSAGERVKVKNVEIEFPVEHVHGVKTLGCIIHGEVKIGYITDTAYFEGLEKFYVSAKDVLIINTTTYKKNPNIYHLCLEEAEKIIGYIKPKLAILTHFGRTMLFAKPWEIAQSLSKKLGIKVVSAYDNMVVDLSQY